VSARAWTLFAAASLLWGLPYLFIKVAVDELEPGFVAWARLALAAAVLLPLALRRGALRGLPLRPLLAFTVLELAIPWPLIGFGEQRVSSSLAAIVIATVPLLAALLAVRYDQAERLGGARLVGLLVGLAGVVALVGIDIGTRPAELLGAGALLVAALGYAAGALIIKRSFQDTDPIGPVAAAMTLGSVLLLPLGVAGMPTQMPSGEAVASVATLGLICSALAFLVFFHLVAEAGASRATVITYVNPIVALLLGAAVLDEQITLGTFAGLLLILAGSWVATGGRLGRRVTDRSRPASHGRQRAVRT
jgi:drug/metabolite transporter (DMT)-like permease